MSLLLTHNSKVSIDIKKKYPQLIVNICGDWVWVSGTKKTDTEIIEYLKSLGLFWSRKKHQWYLEGTVNYKPKGATSWTWEQIKNSYGLVTIDDELLKTA